MNEYEKNILDHIDKFGCSVTSVFDPDEEDPPFTYSIGITKSYGAPEIIIVGLKKDISHWIANEYKRRVSEGETFVFDIPYLGFLEGFPVRFGPVIETNKKEYMRSTCWLYQGSDFDAVQLIWPNTSGVWPWDANASEWFRSNQPLLSKGQPDASP